MTEADATPSDGAGTGMAVGLADGGAAGSAGAAGEGSPALAPGQVRPAAAATAAIALKHRTALPAGTEASRLDSAEPAA
ncbi:MAG: hypothetical protein ACOCYW_09725, partial [Roseicyclus sp.]